MNRVLLVDDERIILEGISQMVDWQAHGAVLEGTAKNGTEAYARIQATNPDIVISDIRMPGMDGLELVARASESHPHIKFIILSGFGEFEYASKAMQYGVKHYLLKPTNEAKIAEALTEVGEELDRERHRQSFVAGMKHRFEKVLPHVKEQVLKEFVTNKTYGKRDWDYYSELFEFGMDLQVRLLLFQLEGDYDHEHLFAVKNIAQDILRTTLLGTTIGHHALILIEDAMPPDELQAKIGEIRHVFQGYYRMDATIALSEAGPISRARALYRETLHSLKYRFYLDEGGLITPRDTGWYAESGSRAPEFDEERLILPVRSGNVEDAMAALSEFFHELKQAQLETEVTLSYVIGTYMSLIRLAEPERVNACYQRIPELVQAKSLQAAQAFLEETVREIAETRYDRNKAKYTAIVRKMIGIVEENLHNAALSLQMVAGEMLYMNPDYLGKLFKKETGEKFSNYVMKTRIRLAEERMAENPDLKVFELAESLGFGDNPQYFSQVFKKFTGRTPSEYLKS
ncbi:response regulator [Cohnella caldifontis]|uniref:response regulator n=1 Tax=Cohnella caldifontis TaxID=3027471 RepID=UPI0023ED4256|nr:response regulator [Cohnella sp. YIM B05605]